MILCVEIYMWIFFSVLEHGIITVNLIPRAIRAVQIRFLVVPIVKIAIITARIILHLISYPQFTYDFFHMHHSFTYLSREHMNPKLTCSQRQWLHSSVGRASHRYREVTGSSPVEVLNFFQASLRNCKNCDHNCEDHSSIC